MITNKKVEFDIRTLLLLEEHINVPIDNLLFDVEVTEEIQAIVNMFGMKLNEEELKEYLLLEEPLKLSVDLKVNSALLDALGVGNKKNDDTTVDTDAKVEVKFFREYIKEFRDYCVGVLYMSKSEFLSYTPVEIYAILDAHQGHIKYMYNLNKIANINAIGLTKSKKFREINPFDENDNKNFKKVSLEKKKADLDFLFNKVGE